MAADAPRVVSVLELFTSQGCSSCPPADALFESYAKRRDVVALTLPVDYWDYLGWRDTLAKPQFSNRQRVYARVRNDGAVYTPQVVVNGRAHVVGYKKPKIDGMIRGAARAGDAILPFSVQAEASGGTLSIKAISDTAPAAGAEPVSIWLVKLRSSVTVDISRGENRGEILTYYNVVDELKKVSNLDHDGELETQIAPDACTGDEACAILLQRGDGGAIVGASWVSTVAS